MLVPGPGWDSEASQGPRVDAEAGLVIALAHMDLEYTVCLASLRLFLFLEILKLTFLISPGHWENQMTQTTP